MRGKVRYKYIIGEGRSRWFSACFGCLQKEGIAGGYIQSEPGFFGIEG